MKRQLDAGDLYVISFHESRHDSAYRIVICNSPDMMLALESRGQPASKNLITIPALSNFTLEYKVENELCRAKKSTKALLLRASYTLFCQSTLKPRIRRC